MIGCLKVIDLPSEVKVDQLVSRLANDGVLTIEAPAEPPTYQAVTARSRDTGTRHVTPRAVPPPPRSSSDVIQHASQVISTGRSV